MFASLVRLGVGGEMFRGYPDVARFFPCEMFAALGVEELVKDDNAFSLLFGRGAVADVVDIQDGLVSVVLGWRKTGTEE